VAFDAQRRELVMAAIDALDAKTASNGDVGRDWPATRAVAHLPGSLPMGGLVADTPIHAFVLPPRALALAARARRTPQRHDIELGGLLALRIDGLLDDDEADAIVEASERFGYRDEAPGIQTPPGMRMNKSVHWMADDSLLDPMFQRMAHLLPQQVDGAALHPRLSRRINMYRYDDGDVFNRHLDGDWPGFELDAARQAMLQWPDALRSRLTMLLYLNGPADGVQGGATRLYARDGRWHDVMPAKGSALFFRHGFGPGSVSHVGCRVQGSVPKYVARINVMFRAD
jgi:2OG-Fe(II) oxygenase superfamily